ncbi:Bardet-Biedl syndrome 1 protein [Entophlyctis sp. JEL0112]|nr:Bardet-Biedl syndrome 1 protein [Entophlyctis sp. JEL0112]
MLPRSPAPPSSPPRVLSLLSSIARLLPSSTPRSRPRPVRATLADSSNAGSNYNRIPNSTLSHEISAETLFSEAAHDESHALASSDRPAPFYIPPADMPSRPVVEAQLKSTSEKEATDCSFDRAVYEPDAQSTWLRSVCIRATDIVLPIQSCVRLVNTTGAASTSLLVASASPASSSASKFSLSTTLRTFAGASLVDKRVISPAAAAVAVVHFYPDTHTVPRIPVVAVAVTDCIYMLHAQTPFQRVRLPHCARESSHSVNQDCQPDDDVWRALQGAIALHLSSAESVHTPIFSVIDQCVQVLLQMADAHVELQPRSTALLHHVADSASALDLRFIEDLCFEDGQPRHQAGCMAVLNKSSTAADAAAILLVATLQGMVYFMCPPTYAIVDEYNLAAPVEHLAAIGLFDKEFCVLAVSLEGKVFILTRGKVSTAGYLQADCVGVAVVKDLFYLACMDQSIITCTKEGVLSGMFRQPAPIMAIEAVIIPEKHFTGYAVSLGNNEVRVYRGFELVSVVETDSPACCLRFGGFGLDSGCLVMLTTAGTFDVRILRRNAQLPASAITKPGIHARAVALQRHTKVFRDTVSREARDSKEIFRVFQNDLARLRTLAHHTMHERTRQNLNPTSEAAHLKLHCQIKGMRPTFKAIITLTNTHASLTMHEPIFIVLSTAHMSHSIEFPAFEIVDLHPAGAAERFTLIRCKDEQQSSCASSELTVLVCKGTEVVVVTKIELPCR